MIDFLSLLKGTRNLSDSPSNIEASIYILPLMQIELIVLKQEVP